MSCWIVVLLPGSGTNFGRWSASSSAVSLGRLARSGTASRASVAWFRLFLRCSTNWGGNGLSVPGLVAPSRIEVGFPLMTGITACPATPAIRPVRWKSLILVRHQPHSGARRIWPGGSNTSRPCAPWGHTPLPERRISTLTWCSGLKQ